MSHNMLCVPCKAEEDETVPFVKCVEVLLSKIADAANIKEQSELGKRK